MRKLRRLILVLTAVVLPLHAGGCLPLLLTPVPIQPWVSERMEEKYCEKNYFRTPIMPPIREGVLPPTCEDPPSEQQILRVMPHVVQGVPYVYEEFRDNYRFVVERIKDSIDPVRFYPPVGPAQLHHCHYKCTIYYTETIESSYPFPFRCVRNRIQVVYIDKDHLHLYAGPNQDAQASFTRDLAP
jgi:hypothetical protein